MNQRLTVDLGARSYPIHIGRHLLGAGGALARCVEGRDVVVVSNVTVAPLYLEQVSAGLAGAARRHEVILPDGERYKTLHTLNRVFTELLERRCGRDVLLVALGGGVVGDLAGYAAAAYHRGVDFVQVPTTLLAQVDSSVGGKTAVNHVLGKNMIGAFHQPVAVFADIATLDSLPDRELAAGVAEVVKYGLITDPAFFDWLETHVEALLARDPEALVHIVRRSCEIKAEVVSADEREAGRRALLNLGHTFGHAIETGLGYGRWLHGEAVAAGMVMAADLSVRMGWLEHGARQRTEGLLASFGLPVRGPGTLDAATLRELMTVDKKAVGGRLRLVLLQAIGAACLTADFDEGLLEATLRECRAR